MLGICGGFQMLGRRIEDPLGVESDRPQVEGLGLIDAVDPVRRRQGPPPGHGRVIDGRLARPGYEIHMGETAARGRRLALAHA